MSIILSVIYAECHLEAHAECGYAECRYAECHYAECRYAECHYAECRYAEWHYAECRYAECHYAGCHYAECHRAILLPPSDIKNWRLFLLSSHFQNSFQVSIISYLIPHRKAHF